MEGEMSILDGANIDDLVINAVITGDLDTTGGSTGWFRYTTTTPGSHDEALDDGLMTTPVEASVDAGGHTGPTTALVFEGDRYDARQAYLKMLTADYAGSGDTDTSVVPPVGNYQAMLDQQNVDVDNDVVTLTGTIASAASRTDSTDRDSASGDSFVFEPAVELGEPITFTASVSGGSGPSGPEDSFVVDNDASTVSARGAMLNAWTSNVCGSGEAGGTPADSVHLIGTSDALAPTDFFLI
jgi:hypothetical protein